MKNNEDLFIFVFAHEKISSSLKTELDPESVTRIIYSLLPVPNRIHVSRSTLVLRSNILVTCFGVEPQDTIFDDFKQDESRPKGLQVEIRLQQSIQDIKHPITEKSIDISDLLCDFTDIPNADQSYSLKITSDFIFLHASTRQGLFYGLQTLIQILNIGYQIEVVNDKKVKDNKSAPEPLEIVLPCAEILDFPSLKIRGVADDITRGTVPTVETIKKYIFELSRFKQNAYALGYEQDWFQFEKSRVLADYRAFLTKDEIQEIDAYAKSRFVELIPIYTSFGHQDNLLQLKKYRDWGEFRGSQCFTLTDPRIYEMIEQHYTELSSAFSSKIFHIGCDESFDLGLYKSKEYLKQKGMGKALLEHYTKIYKLAKEKGWNTILIYHDIVSKFPEELKLAPKDLHLVYWDYEPKRTFKLLTKISQHGLPIILSSSHLNWARPFPDFVHASKNIINLITQGKIINKKRITEPNINMSLSPIEGELNSTWGDFTSHGLHLNKIYSSILSGIEAWESESTNAKVFLRVFSQLFFGIYNEDHSKKMAEIIWNVANLLRYYPSLGVMLPQTFYLHLYRHPFYAQKPKLFIKNYKKLKGECEHLNSLLNTLKPEITQNMEFIDALQYSIDINLLHAEKEQMIVDVYHGLQQLMKMKVSLKNAENHDSVQSLMNLKHQTVQIIDNFIQNATRVKNQFEKSWIQSAKRPVLDYHLGRFSNLIRYCTEKKNQLLQNINYQSPFLPSHWIRSPSILNPPLGAFFRKTILIDQVPKIAKLLVMAGDVCRIYVNGAYIDEVLSRLSLSYNPIHERIKLYDITKELKAGVNLIALECYNYCNIPVNVNALLRFIPNENPNNLEKIHHIDLGTDDSWNLFQGYNPQYPDFKFGTLNENAIEVPNDWNTDIDVDYESKRPGWRKATIIGPPPKFNLHVYDEDLINGVIPYTEEYFGMDSYNVGILSVTRGKTIITLARKSMGLLKRIMKLI